MNSFNCSVLSAMLCTLSYQFLLGKLAKLHDVTFDTFEEKRREQFSVHPFLVAINLLFHARVREMRTSEIR